MTDIIEKTAAQIIEEDLMADASRAATREGLGINAISREGAEAMNMEVQSVTNRIAHDTLVKAFMAGYLTRIREETAEAEMARDSL